MPWKAHKKGQIYRTKGDIRGVASFLATPLPLTHGRQISSEGFPKFDCTTQNYALRGQRAAKVFQIIEIEDLTIFLPEFTENQIEWKMISCPDTDILVTLAYA